MPTLSQQYATEKKHLLCWEKKRFKKTYNCQFLFTWFDIFDVSISPMFGYVYRRVTNISAYQSNALYNKRKVKLETVYAVLYIDPNDRVQSY